ncbi:hypothetical protein GGF31_008181 [Allomyces arbusculus]|nr:hypothetical protein GGF31_008181 [Allomyces arbusculus]
MNAYPPEFVTHTGPLLTVLGLKSNASSTAPPSASATDGATTTSTASATAVADPVKSASPSRTIAGTPLATQLQDAILAQLGPGATPPSSLAVRVMPVRRPLAEGTAVPSGPFQQDAFHVQIADSKSFLSTFPLRPDPGHFSPLSPRAGPSSPLYPDGLIAPYWHTKYAANLPAVVLSFYMLYRDGVVADRRTSVVSDRRTSLVADRRTSVQTSRSRSPSPAKSEVASEALAPLRPSGDAATAVEREYDQQLAGRIGTLRKLVAEQGVKLFICLVVPFEHKIEGDWVEERVGLIRKAAGLDRKYIFLLPEFGDVAQFIKSYKPLLMDPALRFYSAKAATVRKKRARLTPPSPARMAVTSTQAPTALSYLGWLIRYDYKAAYFHELRGDWDETYKLYTEAYTQLTDFLRETQPSPDAQPLCNGALIPGLTPGKVADVVLVSKRWYEAKLLLDVIIIKMMKINFLLDRAPNVVNNFYGHIDVVAKRFDAPTWCPLLAWAFYEWKARFHAMFGDLLDAVQRAGHLRAPIAGSFPADLQSSGAWYHHAAKLTEERKAAALASLPQLATMTNLPSAVQALVDRELATDHDQVRLNLLTRAHDYFRRHRATHSTLFMAKELASVYFARGEFGKGADMLERVVKTYRKQGWKALLASALAEQAEAADRAKNTALLLATKLELLCLEVGGTHVESKAQMDEIHALFETPSGTDEGEPREITLEQPALFDVVAHFTEARVPVNHPIVVRVAVRPRPEAPPLLNDVTAVHVALDNPALNFEVHHDPTCAASPTAVHSWAKSLSTHLVGPTGIDFSVELAIDDVTELSVINVDVVWANEHHKVIFRFPVAPPSGDAALPPVPLSAASGYGSITAHRAVPEAQSQVQVVPPHWMLQYAIEAPSVAVLEEKVPVQVVIAPYAGRDATARHLAASLHVVARLVGAAAGQWLVHDDEAVPVPVGGEPGHKVIQMLVKSADHVPKFFLVAKSPGEAVIQVEMDVLDGDGDHAAAAATGMPATPRSPGSASLPSSPSMGFAAGRRWSASMPYPEATRPVVTHRVALHAAYTVQYSVAPERHVVLTLAEGPVALREDRVLLLDLTANTDMELGAISLDEAAADAASSVVSRTVALGAARPGTVLRKGEIWRHGLLVQTTFWQPETQPTELALGKVQVQWRRPEGDGAWVTSGMGLPTIYRKPVELVVEAEYGPYAVQYAVHGVTFTVTNLANTTADVTILIETPPVPEGADASAGPQVQFAGDRTVHAYILPGERVEVPVNAVPLACGHVELVRCRVVAHSAVTANEAETASAFAKVFVMPERDGAVAASPVVARAAIAAP